MKNAGMAGAVALVGIGLISIALSNVVTAPKAMAAPSAVVNDGPEEPTARVVDFLIEETSEDRVHFYRFWSNGIVDFTTGWCNGGLGTSCTSGWTLVESLSEGYVANADLNGDGLIDGSDLGIVLANYGSSSATLLVNPDLGDSEVIAAELSGYPWWGQVWERGRSCVRIWSSGLVEAGTLPWYDNGLNDPCHMNDRDCTECGDGWHVIPNSMTAQMLTGDINRDAIVDGGDLGLLLGGWDK